MFRLPFPTQKVKGLTVKLIVTVQYSLHSNVWDLRLHPPPLKKKYMWSCTIQTFSRLPPPPHTHTKGKGPQRKENIGHPSLKCLETLFTPPPPPMSPSPHKGHFKIDGLNISLHPIASMDIGLLCTAYLTLKFYGYGSTLHHSIVFPFRYSPV